MLRKGMSLVTVLALVALAVPAVANAQEAHPTLIAINNALAAQGVDYRVDYAEFITTDEGPEFGRTIFASNRGNKQLGHHFVAFDPNRTGSRAIFWIVDRIDGDTASGLTADDTTDAIGRAMDTWQAQICSDIPLAGLGDFDFDFGVVQNILGFGGSPFVFADLTHAGWLTGDFFDALAPGGSNFILGVTFTFIFIDGNGNPLDSDNDGRIDTAFREIYANDAFPWAIDANFDVETVVLHEAGHGLSQGHFGDIFRDGDGGLHFAPLAVMNAAYSGVQQELTGTDNAGHCSIWGSWPN